ncbi:hypothetical protein AA13595_0320 [Gluconacetobacter johannae DSM 13595]|uniref:Secreted protein n=1 Tax=Gluconacetobacter johannae TaxID=112140 RepID=A0A7W4J5E9_9PROT|nr:hypothetical protein [Gluconacetobacter johannae]MBB2174788.1 hypothetical protein [Gluconacetobacter johannae]GBQ80373.1 hypothetical protein AA13595_0320 [Gluconacetobacter johannae DSM 13595]
MRKFGPILCLTLSALLAAPAVPGWAAPPDSGDPTPVGVAAAIQAQGAAQAIGNLNDSNDFDTVTAGIAAADPAWMALVPQMAPGLDSDSGPQVTTALALALPQDARLVLRTLDARYPALDPQSVCARPFGHDEVPDIKGYARRARAALRRVRDSGLRSLRDRCLSVLGR